MNCRRVEKLIPLYVEGDLEPRSSELIASHLEWCGRCNWLADEFRESQSWLRSSEAPEFDKAFLTDFKRDVLKGVSTIRPSFLGSLLGSWTQQWNRRQVLALGAALTIICGVLVLYLYQTRANSGSTVQELARRPEDPEDNDKNDTASPPDMIPVTKPAPGANPRHRHSSSNHTAARSRVLPLFSQRSVEPPLFSGASQWSRTNSPDSQTIPGSTFDSHEMLRIEIQTSDPNIRIIWFAPKETDSNQNKPATD
jgi:putative zinc finger protein